MTVISSLDAGKFTVTRDGVTAFDTSALKKSFNLVPDAAITLTGHTVMFEKFNTGLYYSSYYEKSGPFWFTGCTSYRSLRGQEYGPDKSNVIADELLGTLPVKADYIDIRIKLTRTKAPTKYLGTIDWPQYLPDGEWVNLDGYSTLVEGINNQVQRSMEFVFDAGTGDISLRKRMSVQTNSPTSFITTSSTSTFGFYAPSGQNDGIPYYNVDLKNSGPLAVDPGGVYLPGGPQGCSQSDPTDSSSVYSMDAVITPGRYSAA
jgi:hypothetical protein